jgi:hypothetical protein
MASVGGANFIYATNFRDGVVEVYDSSFSLAKSFTDSTVPDGFAPFGIQNINGKLFITFAGRMLRSRITWLDHLMGS